MSSIDFHFIVPLWGEKYADEFVNVTLPNQLSPGNLGAFRGRSKSDKYKIYTRVKDAEVIKNSPAYAKLAEIMQTEFHFIDDVMADFKALRINKYDVMTICHARGLQDAIKEQAAIVPIPCDVIFSDGSFANMLKLTQAGKRLIVIGSCRVVTETFVPELTKDYYSKDGGTITISSRDLVKLVLKHLHPASKALFLDSKNFFNSSPAYLYWDVKDQGILERGIHLQPMMINPNRKDERLAPEAGMGIDGYDYMMRAVPKIDDVHVVEDSDEIAYFSFCSVEPGDEYETNDFNVLHVARWIRKYCCDYHHDFLHRKIRLHCEDISPEWEKVEQESDKVVNAICNTLDFFEKEPFAQKGIEAVQDQLRARDLRLYELHVTLGHYKFEDAQVHNLLGVEYYKTEHFTQAKKAFVKSLLLYPAHADAHSNLATLYEDQGKLDKAIKHMKNAVKLLPQNPDKCLMLVVLLIKAGFNTEALKYLRQAAALPTEDIEIISALGQMALRLNDSEIANIALNRLKKIEPTHEMVQSLQQAAFQDNKEVNELVK